MEQQTHRNPPPAPSASTASRNPPARPRWTPARQRIFLMCLLDTGCVAGAARAAGMSPSSAYRLRQRLAGTPFDRTWQQVLRRHAERFADPLAPDPLAPPPAPAPAPQAANATPAHR